MHHDAAAGNYEHAPFKNLCSPYLRYDTAHNVSPAIAGPHFPISVSLNISREEEVSSLWLEEMAFRYGRYYDSYLASEPGRELFFSSGRRGFLSYTRVGKYLLVGGGLISPEAHKEELLAEFSQFLAENRLRTAFHNIDDQEAPLFHKYGYEVTKWGEEPVLDLGDITWSGSAFEWVRRQTNFCLRQGVRAYEARLEDMSAMQWSRTLGEMLEINAQCMTTKPQAEDMRFFEGRIDTHSMGHRRLFLARSEYGRGRMEGFVVCTPMLNGTMWSTEMYRHRLDGVRGAVPFLIQHLVDQFQSEGAQRVGLCLLPSLRCGTPIPGDSFLIRYTMQLSNLLPFIMDLPGLQHFKSRFRPRYENRYVCISPKANLGNVIAFIKVFGSFNVSFTKLARILLERTRKRLARKTLAKAN